MKRVEDKLKNPEERPTTRKDIRDWRAEQRRYRFASVRANGGGSKERERRRKQMEKS